MIISIIIIALKIMKVIIQIYSYKIITKTILIDAHKHILISILYSLTRNSNRILIKSFSEFLYFIRFIAVQLKLKRKLK